MSDISVDKDKKQVEMTFRTTDSTEDSKANITLRDLSEGQKFDGIVKKIEDYGLFIEVEGTKIRGLCHKSEVGSHRLSLGKQLSLGYMQISDNKDADIIMALRSFREGDRVKVVVLSVDLDKRRLSLGIKPSYFGDAELQADNASNDSEEEGSGPLGVVADAGSGEDEGGDGSDSHDDRELLGDESEEEEADENDVIITAEQTDLFTSDSTRVQGKSSMQTLDLGPGFEWTANNDADEGSSIASSSDEEDSAQPSHPKKRRRKEIEQDLTADMHTKTPESNADFERLLLGSPNSSYLWVQYMSFQLQLSEVEKARDIARRALKTINFREEGEKLNVWLALLNLENVYGTDETLEVTFKDAARHMDSKTIHLRMAAIFEQSEKFEVRVF